MFFRRKGTRRRPRAGRAGLIASVVIALAGAMLGAFAAFLGEVGNAATAARGEAGAVLAPPQTPREEIVRRLIEGASLERLRGPLVVAPARTRPKIIVIIDDMGVDPYAAEAAFQLPGPLTYSFLPYAENVDRYAARARRMGAEVMLHLPMEPIGPEDPGPMALRENMTGTDFLKTLEWNLDRFDGYVGVNNHMGSRLTADEAAMKTVLAMLKERGVFFLDSVTTSQTAVRRAGAQVGATVIARDVFLDPVADDEETVRRQLELVEAIAARTGYAVAIGHPRPATLRVLGPWLVSAKARGFELATPSSLVAPNAARLAEAPALRF